MQQKDFNYLDIDYDVNFQSDAEKDKIKIWGLPSASLTDPVPVGILSGALFGALVNAYRNRPKFSSNLAGAADS